MITEEEVEIYTHIFQLFSKRYHGNMIRYNLSGDFPYVNMTFDNMRVQITHRSLRKKLIIDIRLL